MSVSATSPNPSPAAPASKLIGTHNGCFHCDESLACAMLLLTNEFKDHEILRTRDLEKLKKCDIVVDVGAVYSHKDKRYDHHQKTFTESMNSLNPKFKSNIKLSSAGLIFFHYGKEVIQSLTGAEGDLLDLLYTKMYYNFIEGIDAVDNGIMANETKPLYKVPNTLPERVGFFNPGWNQDVSEEKIQDNFMKAVRLTSSEFQDRVNFYNSIWLPARSLVENALEQRFNFHPSGKLMMIASSCPWKQHFFDIEEANGEALDVNFVIFADKTLGDYRIQAVPLTVDSFKLRIPLAKEWNGLRDEPLCEVVGKEDCIFVHANGFIGGASSLDTAVLMATKSIEMFA